MASEQKYDVVFHEDPQYQVRFKMYVDAPARSDGQIMITPFAGGYVSKNRTLWQEVLYEQE